MGFARLTEDRSLSNESCRCSPRSCERVLGHAIRGVEGVYDRHKYREEKAHALKALAGLISTILSRRTIRRFIGFTARSMHRLMHNSHPTDTQELAVG